MAAIDRAAFNIRLQGFTAANRDAEVTLVQEATGQTITRKPFLDGTLAVRDLDPGFYEVVVRHPNLVQEIDRRRVRLFPSPTPTQIFVPVPAELFRDTPIRDVPDADLGPVQQTLTATRASLQTVGGKAPGEAIRAADWNTLTAAVSDLCGAVLQLTALVAPRGHNHPELEEKIGEVQENVRRFGEAFGRSLLEMQREVEAANLRRQLTDVLDLGAAPPALRDQLFGRVDDLVRHTQTDTPNFTRKLSVTGAAVLNAVNDLAVAQGANGDAFLQNEAVQKLRGAAAQYAEAGTQTRAESELQTYQRTTAAAGSRLSTLLQR
jgi:hypothetical protein